jgi:hypothetical protein
MTTVELSLSEADLDAIAERVAQKLADKLKTSTNDNGPEKEFWNEADAVGVSKYSLARWRRDGHIAAASDKRPIRYSRENLDDVKNWLRTR